MAKRVAVAQKKSGVGVLKPSKSRAKFVMSKKK